MHNAYICIDVEEEKKPASERIQHRPATKEIYTIKYDRENIYGFDRTAVWLKYKRNSFVETCLLILLVYTLHERNDIASFNLLVLI